MNVAKSKKLIDSGGFSTTERYRRARRDVVEAIREVNWPPGNSDFVIAPRENENGVNPITDQFEGALARCVGWEATGRRHLKTVLDERELLGDAITQLEPYCADPYGFVSSPWFDAVKTVEAESGSVLSATEWETGNISSSHRSLNRLTLGLAAGVIETGFIVLPTRDLYVYLTDRVGNYRELEPYFWIWSALEDEVDTGVLEVIAVKHDDTSTDVPPIGKLTDGMAQRDESEVGNGQPGESMTDTSLEEY